MKKLLLINVAAFSLLFVVNSQTVLTRALHALEPGKPNPMSYCSYLDPGQAGQNITWDFKGLAFEKSFTGYINHSALTKNGVAFTSSNTELAEFDSRFYFKTTDNAIEQYGYSSEDGSTRVFYTEPCIKIKFPFAYGDAFSGKFTGKLENSGIETAQITGTYQVEADANGTLILPGGVKYINTLRVKSIKSYTNKFPGTDQNVVIETFRWYNNAHRYPLAVLTKVTTTIGGNESLNYQAAYNNDAVSSLGPILTESVEVYPNPSTGQSLNIQFTAVAAGTISFEIIDLSGKIVHSFTREVSNGGYQQFDLANEVSTLRPALYTLKVVNGNSSFTRNISLIN